MKVYIKKEAQVGVPACNMKVGQVGECVNPAYGGAIILKTYTNFVSLTNPLDTWSLDCSIPVNILPKGTDITLTTEN